MMSFPKHCFLIPFLVVFLAVSAQVANAETQYVRDELVITLRSAKGDLYQAVGYLTSGDAVEILEKDGEYLKVRTKGGDEGWVLEKYISSNTPKSVRISLLEREISRLKGKLSEAGDASKALQDELAALRSSGAEKVKEIEKLAEEKAAQVSRTAGELQEMSEKYTALAEQSKDVVGLMGERDRLQTENERLSEAREQLRKENESLKRREMMWWFLAGGGVFFVGWIVGKASRQKRFY